MRKLCLFPAIFIAAALIAAAQLANPSLSEADQPKSFASMQQLAEYIKSSRAMAQFGYGPGSGVMTGEADPARPQAAGTAIMNKSLAAPSEPDSYSSTNIQVEGVDEADIVKNDGKYLYVVSAGRVNIVEAYPAGGARLLSSIKCDGMSEGIFLNGDRLLVISRRTTGPGMLAVVYDITDRARPAPVRTLAWEGDYTSSRMIGGYAYLVLNMPVNYVEGQNGERDTVTAPRITENGKDRVIPPGRIYYFDYPDYDYRYTVVVSVNLMDAGKEALCKTYLTGTSQNIYASARNLYLTGPKAPDVVNYTNQFINEAGSLVAGEASKKIKSIGVTDLSPDQKLDQAGQILEEYLGSIGYAESAVLEEKLASLRERLNRDMERDRNKTIIHKLALHDGSIEYECRGEVNGTLLNQFSMDEDNGYFRVATTSEGLLFLDRPSTRNNIYILDGGLNVVGRLEGLAPRERIYSARFVGSRAYLVTFRNMDPLFAIDLKDPKSPKVLGELKIPGFSDYLHPYDENHLIGIGKDAPVNPVPQPMPPLREGGAAVPQLMPPRPIEQQGVKIALFDVTNPEKPIEMARYVVDQPGADSEVSRDHRAFLFSRSKNLMALPVSYALTSPLQQKAGLMPYYRQWQGMYVFSISTEGGIKLTGKIEHPAQSAGTAYAGTEPIRRAAYINEVFYTVSEGAVKLSSLDSLKEIKMVKLPGEADGIHPYPVRLID